MKRLTLYTCDAFSKTAFGGNPAAVVILDTPLKVAHYQCIAREMNLSETAFVYPLQKQTNDSYHYAIRWFTPTGVEVPLCGHGTMASAAVLYHHEKLNPSNAIAFQTQERGQLSITRNNTLNTILMDFPAGSPATIPALDKAKEVHAALLDALFSKGHDSLDTTIVKLQVCPVNRKLLVHFKDPSVITKAVPNQDALLAIPFDPSWNIKGVTITATPRSSIDDDTIDFISRYFTPWNGIPEDPVNGSGHCMLAIYWQRVLQKDHLVGYQASARGGTVHMDIQGDRVVLGGEAAIVVQGTIPSPL